MKALTGGVIATLLWLAPLVAMPGLLFAQTDVSGSVDHPALQRFNESWIIDYRRDERVNHLLVLGTMRRAGGRVVPENAVRLHGNVTRITYEIPQAFTGADAYQFFLDQIEARGYRQLFVCSGRDCGNSDYWANDVFNIRTLYGPERNQFYLAAELGTPENERYLSLYIITRANRRISAYLEVIEVDSAGDGTGISGAARSLQMLLQQGSLRLTPVTFDEEDNLLLSDGLQTVVELLEENPDLNVYIVAYLRVPGAYRSLMQRSLDRAEAVREALSGLGIDEDRIVAQGVGPLAPRCAEGDCDERVELVLQQ
ncbi:MAG: DUF4892 domain-containing protein [Pseudohongiellaceae bacterium]